MQQMAQRKERETQASSQTFPPEPLSAPSKVLQSAYRPQTPPFDEKLSSGAQIGGLVEEKGGRGGGGVGGRQVQLSQLNPAVSYSKLRSLYVSS